ncbi:MAG: hypothetical protein WC943_09560 [Elusimicrobiota bacterium]|jgi:hypothetical protein
MKKLLGSVLAIAMLVQPGVASAELLKNFKLSGNVDMQSQASRNVLDFVTRQDPKMNDASGTLEGAERPTFNDRMNDAQFRVIVNMDWDILDDVHAKVTLGKNDRAWGTNGGTAMSGLYATQTAKQTVGVGGGTNVLGQLFVEQAYVKIDKVFGHVDATVGRQYFGEAGDVIIYFGPRNVYGQPVNALDAVRADIYGLPYVNITGIAGKAVGSALYSATNNSGSAADQDVRGFNMQLKDVENIGAEFFLYNRLTHARGALGFTGDDISPQTNTGRNDYLTVYGLRGKVNFGGFTAKMLFAKNNGANRARTTYSWDKNQDGIYQANLDAKANPTSASELYLTPSSSYSGWAWTIDAEFKAEIEDIASFTPWMHFAMGTGRNSLADAKNQGFMSINSDYSPGTIYGRFGQFLGSAIPCVIGAVGCGTAAANTGTDIDGDGTINGLGVRTQGNHMGAANIGGVGLNNRVIWGLGLKTTPAFAPKLTAAVSWYQFRFQKVTDDKIVWQNPTTFDATRTASYATSPRAVYCNGTTCYARLPNAGASTGAPDMGHYYDGQNNTQGFSNGQNNKHIGDEIDIDFTWKHSDNVSFQAGMASFRPGKYIQSMIADNYNANNAAEMTALGTPAVGTTRTNTTAPGMRVSNNPVVMAYGDMHIKF